MSMAVTMKEVAGKSHFAPFPQPPKMFGLCSDTDDLIRSGALLFDLGNVTYKQGMLAAGEEKSNKLSASRDYYNRSMKVCKAAYGGEDVSVADGEVASARLLLESDRVDTELQEAK